MHLKTALSYIRRSPFQAMAAVSVLSLTFFIATLLAVLIYASNQVLVHFETRPQVIAFLKDEATTEQITNLQRKLSGDERVGDISFVTKEEAFTIYKDATSDNPLLAELVSPSIFPASLEFSLKDLQYARQVVEEIKQEAIVESVGFTASIGGEDNLNDVVENLKTATLYIRIGGISLVAILTGASFLVLMVVIGLRITTRKNEIEILDLLGATGGFIRAPVVLEAIVYSIIGTLIGWIVALILLLYATPSIIGYFSPIPILPKNSLDFFLLLGLIFLAELIVGVLIALGGSLIAVSRARR
ncbi:hypothetical protein A2975_04715 [Candidatus Woesebacteria bacterium RIFCSPLOWO2_01_FULL_44_14]|uniref:Cell division protein FtsX n=1 Tax=Candidatus Woesebacteria bacterium RIFCSPLOWO2_01_FULL_44_14 TaxID=1802525 RepID=A0A1F8C1U6_9BACT|nr:MAG: hypothetical protein A2975_04715 [Candidatus Woesebacteria bacterium RIFCSPLOWO2_01_FULL_44_14]